MLLLHTTFVFILVLEFVVSKLVSVQLAWVFSRRVASCRKSWQFGILYANMKWRL